MKRTKFRHGVPLHPSWFSAGVRHKCNDHYCTMFSKCDDSALEFTEDNKRLMDELGDLMGRDESGQPRAVSNIPAGYTYFGQFVDHDITLDPFSSLDQINDPAKTRNFRTPALDLDNLYGGGPAVSPFLYDHDDPIAPGIKLLLGRNQDVGRGGPPTTAGTLDATPTDFDLPRTSDGTALIGDPRNDENLVVSQLHAAFLKFHNRVVDHLLATGTRTSEDVFGKARTLVTHHYQWVVVNDFLRRILPEPIFRAVFDEGKTRFLKRSKDRFCMPIEFAAAAYRFGHSMVRDVYDFNVNFPNSSFINAFNFVARPRLPVFSNWVVDFHRFFQTGIESHPDPAFRINMAMKIDTNLALSLEQLPAGINDFAPPSGGAPNFMAILASRNLRRGLAFQLPSGQCVAERVTGEKGRPFCRSLDTLLPPHAVGFLARRVDKKLLKGVRVPPGLDPIAREATDPDWAKVIGNPDLCEKTPLWYYILREAETAGGDRLGTVGATIVAETFYRMLKDDPESYLNTATTFAPSLPGKDDGTYDIVDILTLAGVLRQ
ncbi:MAG: heme peroxidase family protein [Myxococcales bacterium]|nr:heme peroxidase family protein [Myxococcales bacterium]